MRADRNAILMAALAASIPYPSAASPADDLWAALDALSGTVTIDAGSVTREGPSLIVEDLVIALEDQVSGDRVNLAWNRLSITDKPDGSVSVVPQSGILLAGSITGPSGQKFRLEGAIDHPDAALTLNIRPDGMQAALDLPAFQGSLTATDPAVAVGASKSSPKGQDARVATAEFGGTALSFEGSLGMSGRPTVSVRSGAASFNARVSGYDEASPFDLTLDLAGWTVSLEGRLDAVPAEGLPFPGGRAAFDLSLADLSLAGSGSDSGNGGSFDIQYRLSDAKASLSAEAGTPPPGSEMPQLAASGTLGVGNSEGAVGIHDPVQPITMTTTGTSRPSVLSFTLKVPAGADRMDFGQALAAGLSATIRLDSEGSTTDASFSDGGMSGRLATTMGRGRLEIALSPSGFLYDLVQEGLSFLGEIPTVQTQVEASLSRIGMRIGVPLVPGPVAQPLVASLRVTDLELSDAVWNLFDPNGVLPRTPARLILDVSGTTQVAEGAFTEDASAPDMPFVPESLDITAAELAFGGAEARATGALTFVNDGPVPVPVGRIEGTIDGAYALLQTLARFGLPPEAIMGARGVLAMFGRPVGPDRLAVSVDFRDDGRIWANGAPIPMP